MDTGLKAKALRTERVNVEQAILVLERISAGSRAGKTTGMDDAGETAGTVTGQPKYT